MREIKFRAWDAVEGKMWNPIVRPDGLLMASNQIGGYVTYYEDTDPLMQYTGLKDKNGTEIYEGDIVTGYYGEAFEVKIGWMIVDAFEVYGCNIWTFYGDLDNANGERVQSETEVIGNIHENPELLK